MENGELTRWFHLCEWIGQFICIGYPVGRTVCARIAVKWVWRIMFAPAMQFVKIRLCDTSIANHVYSLSSIFNSPFRSRKISAPSIDRTAPQCYNKVILKKRKREVIYYEKP